MQTEQGTPTEVGKARALPQGAILSEKETLTIPGHTTQNEIRVKRDIQTENFRRVRGGEINKLTAFLWLDGS